MKAVRLALVPVLLLATHAFAREPRIGDSVAVISDEAEVRSKEGTLGTVPLGTQFTVKQTNRTWLLGLFQIEGRSAWGWMKSSSVQVMELEITRQPTHEFTWHNLLLARDKIDDSFTLEDHVDDYMKTTREKVWNKCRFDEFQLRKKRVETLTLLKKRVASFDIERDFMLTTTLTFKSYDFKTGTFSIKEATEASYWYGSGRSSDSLPTHIKVHLNDPKMIGGISMGPEEAERFIASRKSDYGSIDRQVYASIRLRISGVRDSGDLESDVRWVQLFSDKGRTRLLYETPKSPLQLKADSESVPPTTLSTVQANPLPTVPSAVRRPRVPDVEPPVSIAQPGTPSSFPMALPATLPALHAGPSHFTQQPIQQGQS